MRMFSRNLGDEILPVESMETSVQGAATRDSRTREIFIKLINPQPRPESLQIELKGIAPLASKASVITLSAAPEETNSIEHPQNVVPVTTTLARLQPAFSYTLPPNSIVVLKLTQ